MHIFFIHQIRGLYKQKRHISLRFEKYKLTGQIYVKILTKKYFNLLGLRECYQTLVPRRYAKEGNFIYYKYFLEMASITAPAIFIA